MNPDDAFPQEVLKAIYESLALEVIDREGGIEEQCLIDAMARSIDDGVRVERWLGRSGWRLGESEIARRTIAKLRASGRIVERDGKLHRSPALCLFCDSQEDVVTSLKIGDRHTPACVDCIDWYRECVQSIPDLNHERCDHHCENEMSALMRFIRITTAQRRAVPKPATYRP